MGFQVTVIDNNGCILSNNVVFILHSSAHAGHFSESKIPPSSGSLSWASRIKGAWGFILNCYVATLWILDKWFNHMITWRWWGKCDLQIYHTCLFLVPRKGATFCVCEVRSREKWEGMNMYVIVSTRMFLHTHIHVWLGSCYLSASQSYSTRWTHIGQRPQVCQGTQARLTWFSCLPVF